MTIKIGTKLPKREDRNGLGVIARELLTDPAKPHMAIVVLDTAKITRDIEADDVFPTVRIVAIEPIVSGDVGRLRTMLQRAYEARTGNMELPADWESVLAEMASPAAARNGAGRVTEREVVKVRMRGHSYTSPSMTSGQAAEDLRHAIAKQVADIGGGFGLFEFVGRDGRPVSIRGRDVTAVERAPEISAPTSLAAAVVPEPVSSRPTPEGTAWLRDRTARGQSLEQFADLIVTP